jgi:antitoxin (DNA-binding transcriptional repressor) of toxin-antitoxin stability system
MMSTIPIEETSGSLAEFIEKMSLGEEVVITSAGEPIAVIRASLPKTLKPRQLGSMKGSVLYISPDFDDPIM